MNKKKPKVIYVIAALFFVICMVIHILIDIRFSIISILGAGYYIACTLCIVYAFKSVKCLPSVAAAFLCACNIKTVFMIYNVASGKTLNSISGYVPDPDEVFEMFFELYNGRYPLAMLMFFILLVQ